MDSAEGKNGTGLAVEASPKIEIPQAQTYRLPSLEKGPASFYDTETRNFWVGLPGQTDPVIAGIILDKCKFEYLTYFQAEMANRSRLLKPSAWQKTKDFVSKLTQKNH